MREKLTPKQKAFINAYLETGNASEAYRRAYDAAGMLPATIHRKAAELLENGKITVRLAVLSDKAEVKALLSLEEHMEELKSLRDKAKDANQFSGAIAAEVKRGEARRFYVKQVEHGDTHDFDRKSVDELRAYIAEQEQILASLTAEGEPKPTIAARSNGRDVDWQGCPAVRGLDL